MLGLCSTLASRITPYVATSQSAYGWGEEGEVGTILSDTWWWCGSSNSEFKIIDLVLIKFGNAQEPQCSRKPSSAQDQILEIPLSTASVVS